MGQGRDDRGAHGVERRPRRGVLQAEQRVKRPSWERQSAAPPPPQKGAAGPRLLCGPRRRARALQRPAAGCGAAVKPTQRHAFPRLQAISHLRGKLGHLPFRELVRRLDEQEGGEGLPCLPPAAGSVRSAASSLAGAPAVTRPVPRLSFDGAVTNPLTGLTHGAAPAVAPMPTVAGITALTWGQMINAPPAVAAH